MKKTIVKGISVFLAVWMVFAYAAPTTAGALEMNDSASVGGKLADAVAQGAYRRLVVDERDADGNLIPPYYVDENGEKVEPQASGGSVAAAVSLPSKYDLRDYGYVTPVKNQAESGSCWAFSTISAMESSMIKQGYGDASDFDYSEAHLAWFGQRQRATDPSDPTYGDGKNESQVFWEGSNPFHASATLMRGSGVQLESNAPWTEPGTESDAMRDMTQREEDRYVSYGRLYQAECIYDNNITRAKTLLMQNANLSFSYYHDKYWKGWNDTYNCYYQNDVTDAVSHSASIVGWDDNFSRTKFNASMRPTTDGAWLVKGSGGTNLGVDGYYWLSYQDPSIDSMFSFVAKPKDTFDSINQYDGSITLFYYDYQGSAITANRFRSTQNEMLTHAAFWSANGDALTAKVEVYVADPGYSGVTGNDPTSNMTLVSDATTTLNDVRVGYYTVELEQPVNVSNKYYTVVLTLTNPSGGIATAAFEGFDDDDLGITFGAKNGQSYVYDESIWLDCNDLDGEGTSLHNVPIKAMTKKISGFMLNYNANGGKNAPDSQTGEGIVRINGFVPDRDGYVFLGWSTSPSDTVVRYVPTGSFNLTADTTLYAVWRKEMTTAKTYNYDVIFHQSEARSILPMVNALRSGSNAWYWNEDNKTKTYPKNLSALKYDYDLESTAMQLAAELVARYSSGRPNDGSVWEMFNHDRAGRNYAYGYTTAASVQEAWEGATAEYANQGGRRLMLNSDYTAMAVACAEYDGVKYWVQLFRCPSGSTTYTAPYDDLTGVEADILDKYITADCVVPSPSMISVEAGSSEALPTVTEYVVMAVERYNVLSGDKIVSWSSANTSVARVSGSSVIGVSKGTTTLTGTYDGGSKVSVPVTVSGSTAVYTLTYNANGGSGAPANQTGNGSITLSDVQPSRTGYTFLGWSKTSNANTAQYTSGASFDLTANTTLYAVWKANTYTVKFNGNGSTSGSMSNQSFTYDTAQNLTANAFKRAYTVTYNYNGATGGNASSTATATATFNGWATSSGGSKVYNDKQNVRNLATSGTVNLYADWTLGSVTLPTPTKTGSIFGGWYTNSALTVSAGAAGESYTPTANTTLYAKWTTVSLTSVSIKTLPTTTAYSVGDTLDTTGLTLTAKYSDNSTKTIMTGFTCSPTKLNTAGTQTITVTYKEGAVTMTATFTVVVGKTFQSIIVATKPTKTKYFVGDTLDTTGMVVKAVYSGGSTAVVTGWTCSPTKLNTAGSRTITVTYKEDGVSKTATFTVDVEMPSISASPNPLDIKVGKTGTISYTTQPEGQTVSISVVKVGNTTHIRNGNTITFTGKSEGTDELDLYMNYNGTQYKKRITINVTKDKELDSISVTTLPKKLDYNINDTLDTTGMVVTAKYTDGSFEDVTGFVQCSPTALTKQGEQTITVTYRNQTATFPVRVFIEHKLESIMIKTEPTKTVYYVGDDFDDSGLTLTAHYTDKTYQTITSGFNCTGFNSDSPGTKTITVKYKEGSVTAQAKFTVTVQEPDVESIAVKSMPTKTTYRIGESFDDTGLTLTVTYTSGSTATITSGFTCTGFSSSASGTKTITVTYKGATATFTVTVAKAELKSIAVKTMPSKTTYKKGDSFDKSGLTLTATYTDNSTKTITSGFTCTPQTLNSAGKQTITVSYTEDGVTKTTTFAVTVEDDSFTLTYHANGGNGAPAAQKGSKQYTVTSQIPSRTGYDFLGWSTSLEAETAEIYLAGETITLTENTTLYAIWQLKGANFTASTTEVSFAVNSSTTITFAHSGFNTGVTILFTSHDTFKNSLDGKLTWGKWENHAILLTLNAEKIGTTTFKVILYASETGEILSFKTIKVTVQKYSPSVTIRNPSVTTIRYIDTLYLHASVKDLPEGAKLVWSADGNAVHINQNKANEKCTISGHPDNCYTCQISGNRTGTSTVTCTVCDADGNPLTVNGKVVQDSVEISAKAGFFMRLFFLFLVFFGKVYKE